MASVSFFGGCVLLCCALLCCHPALFSRTVIACSCARPLAKSANAASLFAVSLLAASLFSVSLLPHCALAQLSSQQVSSPQVFGGEATPPPPPPLQIRGLSTEDITALYGAPDAKHPTRSGESWQYGGSSILFSENVVTGWSDIGELHEREVLHSLHRRPSSELPDPTDDKGWSTPWRRQERIPAEEVVDELLEPVPSLARKR